ncbi:hypothetical protein BH11BAC3_BH11BAC3_26620 [soil metagenome]
MLYLPVVICRCKNSIFADKTTYILKPVNYRVKISVAVQIQYLHCDFDNCVIEYASFSGRKMTTTVFTNTSLKNVDFSQSHFTKSILTNTHLSEELFDATMLKEVNLSAALTYCIDPENNCI